MSLSSLPPEILQQIARDLPFDEVLGLCKSNAELAYTLCKDEYFWRQRLANDLGVTRVPLDTNPYDYYANIYKNRRWYMAESDGLYRPINHNVKRVVSNKSHMLMEDTDGALWAIGNNAFSVISLGKYMFARPDFTKLEYDSDRGIIDLTVGNYFFAVLDSDGRLWFKGRDIWIEDFSQNTSPYGRFVTFPDQPVGFTKIFSGRDCLFALGKDGKVWGTGWGLESLLGPIDITGRFTPILGEETNVVKVSCGMFHAMFLDRSGNIWGIGSASIGELGIEGVDNTGSEIVHVAGNIADVWCGPHTSLALDNNGDVWGLGVYNEDDVAVGIQPTYTPPRLLFHNAAEISRPTRLSSLMIDTDDNLWSMHGGDYTRVPGTKAWDITSGDRYVAFNGIV